MNKDSLVGKGLAITALDNTGPVLSMYPPIWFVAHSGFLQSGPHTKERADAIVTRNSLDDLEWEAVQFVAAETVK